MLFFKKEHIMLTTLIRGIRIHYQHMDIILWNTWDVNLNNTTLRQRREHDNK